MVPRTVAGLPWSISTSPTWSSVVNAVPVPVTLMLPFVNVTVPVRAWIQVDAVFQLTLPVALLMTEPAYENTGVRRSTNTL